MWLKLSLLAAAGALGTLARYSLSSLIQHAVHNSLWGLFNGQPQSATTAQGAAVFPWGTLAVNVLGCFLFGLAWSVVEHRVHTDSHTKLIVFVGFLGAFTTFSTYLFETGQMMRSSQWLYVAAHVLAQNGLGLAALFAGLMLGQMGRAA